MPVFYTEDTVMDWMKCPDAKVEDDDDVIISVQTINKVKLIITVVAVCKE